jgi:hypothetical protein
MGLRCDCDSPLGTWEHPAHILMSSWRVVLCGILSRWDQVWDLPVLPTWSSFKGTLPACQNWQHPDRGPPQLGLQLSGPDSWCGPQVPRVAMNGLGPVGVPYPLGGRRPWDSPTQLAEWAVLFSLATSPHVPCPAVPVCGSPRQSLRPRVSPTAWPVSPPPYGAKAGSQPGCSSAPRLWKPHAHTCQPPTRGVVETGLVGLENQDGHRILWQSWGKEMRF